MKRVMIMLCLVVFLGSCASTKRFETLTLTKTDTLIQQRIDTFNLVIKDTINVIKSVNDTIKINDTIYIKDRNIWKYDTTFTRENRVVKLRIDGKGKEIEIKLNETNINENKTIKESENTIKSTEATDFMDWKFYLILGLIGFIFLIFLILKLIRK